MALFERSYGKPDPKQLAAFHGVSIDTLANTPIVGSCIDAQSAGVRPYLGGRMKEKYQLNVLGAVSLQTEDGHELTPAGGVKKALLAYLALSKGPKTRVKLQDMFWGSRAPEQAATSFRNALSNLRSSLGPLAKQVLLVTNHTVGLDMERLDVDLYRFRNSMRDGSALDLDLARLPDLLEGLDIPGGSSCDFEEWLQLERSLWRREIDQYLEKCAGSSQSSPHVPASFQSGHGNDGPNSTGTGNGLNGSSYNRSQNSLAQLSLSIRMPSIDLGLEDAALAAHMCLDFITANLSAEGVKRIYDYRSEDVRTAAEDQKDRANLILISRVQEFGGLPRLSLRLLNAHTLQVYWQSPLNLQSDLSLAETRDALSAFSSQSSDSILRTFEQVEELDTTCLQYQPYNILGQLFETPTHELPGLSSRLDLSYQQTKDPIILALKAYLNTFRVGEHWGELDDEVCNETDGLIRRAMVEGADNPVLMSLIGHSAWYVCHDFDLGNDLLSRSVEMAPSHAFCCDQMALNYLYQGDYDQAGNWAQRAFLLGRFSALRHIYKTTQAMALILAERQREGVNIALNVLAKHPNFAAATRYAILGLGELDRIEEAHALLRRLIERAPSFSLNWFSNNRLAMRQSGIEDRFINTFRKVGLE